MDEFPTLPGADSGDPDAGQLMGIGRFSALSRLSVRMLRHYDSHGVLVPADVDPWTGHRRYGAEQLVDAADIRNLRDVGFGVPAISALLASRGTSTWHSALQMQRTTLLDELREAQGRLTLIDRLLTQGATMSTTITVECTTVAAMSVVALRGSVPTYSDEGLLWQQMMPLLGDQGITTVGPCGVVEHDREYVEHDPDLSVFVPVAPGARVVAPLELVELPARECLVARVLGPYDQISSAHDLINQKLVADGLAPRPGDDVASKAFNLYLTTPDEVAPQDLVTDVHVPIA